MNIKDLEAIGVSAMQESYKVHESLGVEGEQIVAKNQFGDTAVKADIECEKAIINLLISRAVPIKIISEEHGTFVIGENPIFTGVLDGLDGSSVYKKARGVGRYGTMFAIFSGLNPTYNDYLFSGTMEHSVDKLCYSTKDGGSFMISGGKKNPISCNGKKELDRDGLIYIDEYFEINRNTFSKPLAGYNTKYAGSSCVYYADVASGEADMALECTRKGNLEIAVAHGLIRGSGGVMLTLDGEKIDDKKYLEFGQEESVQVITAATLELARDLLRHIKV